MRKKVLVRAPVLTRSGYGEHGRFVLRALREREDLFEIFIIPIAWGMTGWLAEDSEERKWIDSTIAKTAEYGSRGGQWDISIQVTIPNEWEPIAPINIGVTAGIETTRVAPVWLEKVNMMDRVITVSEHSKAVFESTVYEGQNKNTGQPMTLKCETPVDVVHYPVKTYDNVPDLGIDFDYDFNFLAVAQQSPRKNIENTIRWFVEENIDQKVGLVLKTFIKNGCIPDLFFTEGMLKGILSKYPERKCKIYLLHGDMTDEEMHALYLHPKIKCLVSTTHGEGFGLPIFEAAYSSLPIIAPGWSGQCDFLYAPYLGDDKKKKGKNKKRPYFSEVDFDVQPIPPHAVWEGVLMEDSMWCYPAEGSFKMKIRRMRKNYSKSLKRSKELQGWIFENFKEEDMNKKFTDLIYTEEAFDVENWLDGLNVEEHA